jgi:hypothetical protein
MIEKGEPWGGAASRPPDIEVEGGDVEIARCVVADGPVPLVRYRPSPAGDLARAVGLTPDNPGGTELLVDALQVSSDAGPSGPAVNAVVVGHAPDRLTRWTRRRSVEVTIDGRRAWKGRATGVVVANGQYLRGLDIVPRGHPGDGRAEIHVYALEPGERGGMRRRLATGAHVPHPRILERSGRVVEIVGSSPMPVEVDGQDRGPASRLRVAVLPGALRLLV